MIINLCNNNISKYFGDTTYHCIPPTMRKYKLFIISGFDLKKKKISICCYALIPDETFVTYNEVFSLLKQNYKFSPKIFTLDYNKALSNALKAQYPDCLLMKCYFHWVKAIYSHLKKFGYYNGDKKSRTNELLYNIKCMAFIDTKLMKKFFDKILFEFEKEYELFFKYFKNYWINYKKLGKYTPIFNFYNNINNSEFDTKYLFFTNNIAENINKLLNANFYKNYPSFLEWKNAILNLHENFEKNNSELLRRNYCSNSLIYYIKNVNIARNKNISLLSKDDIKNINLIKNTNFNYNNLSSHSILDLLDNNNKKENTNNNLILLKNNDDEENIDDNNDDSVAELINKFEDIDVEQNKDLKYYIIENIKLLNLDKINKEIKDEITELKQNKKTK